MRLVSCHPTRTSNYVYTKIRSSAADNSAALSTQMSAIQPSRRARGSGPGPRGAMQKEKRHEARGSDSPQLHIPHSKLINSLQMLPPSSLDFLPRGGRWSALRDLRGVHGPVTAVAFSPSPTLHAPRRALVPRRWRDAMSEGPFGRSPGRTKLAEPSSDRDMRIPPSPEHGRPSTSIYCFW
jgi:hypothetical protein